MTGIIPIPTTRTSDPLISQRLLAQLRSDERSLLRVQSQLSTGRRIFAPSEDAPAAHRALTLQRLLEQKQQTDTNRNATQSYLAASESALSDVANLLSEARGLAVSVADTVASDDQRQAVIAQLQRTIDQLIDVGNHTFRGRYLFGGSQSSTIPFTKHGPFVAYSGNEGHLQSFADVDLLATSNAHGNEVFGAISPEVLGTVDLNPILTPSTRLAELRGGLGIGEGSFAISDGVSTKTIDISSAETIGDLIRLIESNPPDGRTITARATSNGLQIEIDAAGGGNLSIAEVAGGTTAEELGILDADGNGTNPIVGEDLDPILRPTTRLDDIFGVQASALVSSPSPNSDLVFELRDRGAAGDGLAIQFVDDDLLQAAGGLSAGNETATYSDVAVAARASLQLAGPDNDLILTANQPGTALNNVRIDVTTAALGNAANVSLSGGVLTIEIDSAGQTTVAALQSAVASDGNFTASFDTSLEAGVNAAATIDAASAGVGVGVGVGNTGNSGGEANTVFIHIDAGQTTANDVIAAVENSPQVAALVSATLDEKDAAAIDPGTGLVDVNASGITAGGSGVEFDQTSGIQITNAGETHVLDFQTAETVEDLLNIINGSGAHVLAEINSAHSGINIRSRLSGSDFHIGENGGQTATHLGVRSFTGQTTLDSLNQGFGVTSTDGTDFIIRRNDGTELEIDVSNARTVQDVLDLINNHPDNLDPATAVVARLAPVGNGIQLVDDNPAGGETLTVIQDFHSHAADDLGLVPDGQTQSGPATPATIAGATLSFTNPVNTGIALTANQAGTALNDVEIIFQDTLSGNVANAQYFAGSNQLVVDIDAAQTDANAVIAAIGLEGTFSASLSTAGDPTNDGTGVVGDVGSVGSTAGGAAEALDGRDVGPLETKGVFNTLVRMINALDANDVVQLERAVELLDVDFNRLVFARSEIGARQQYLDVLDRRLGDEQVELQRSLSEEIDVDLAEAISELTQRQASFQASLQSIGRIYQLTLLDFL